MRIFLAASASLIMVLLSHSFAKAAIAPQTQAPSCSLSSEGIFGGSWVKHRILIGEEVIFGANEMDAILSQLDNLRNQGLCQ